jgi:hypothetical protein
LKNICKSNKNIFIHINIYKKMEILNILKKICLVYVTIKYYGLDFFYESIIIITIKELL